MAKTTQLVVARGKWDTALKNLRVLTERVQALEETMKELQEHAGALVKVVEEMPAVEPEPEAAPEAAPDPPAKPSRWWQ